MFKLPLANDHYGYRFGERDTKGRFHPGFDFNGPGAGDADLGLEVRAIGPGEVTFVSPDGLNGGWGKVLFIRHDMAAFFASQGIAKPDWCPDKVWSQYAHLEAASVAVGAKVDATTVIGKLGKSGAQPTAHLHWEIRKRPLGVYYYPPASLTTAEFHERYLDGEDFIKQIAGWLELKRKDAPKPSTDALSEAKALAIQATRRADAAEGKLAQIRGILNS